MPDPSGPQIGRYHLVEPIGGGPTGEVFRAKVYGVAGFERQYAVKRFHAALGDDPARAKLLAEAARAYQTIEHPRIARISEYGVADGAPFAAVELIGGVDLGKLIAGTFGNGEPLSQGGALGLMTQLARAIGYAHGRGVLHVGLCPTNVQITPDGDLKVMDFGWLRARLPARPADDPTLAARLPYLAPEQLTGGALSAATDVFQIATLTYELLSGERAYGGASSETAAKIVAGALPELPITTALLAALRRAAAPSPAQRFPDASAFADALDAAVRGAGIVGGRSDVASAVRRTSARLADMSQMSGAVSFPMPAPPPSAFAPAVPLRASSLASAERFDDAPTGVSSSLRPSEDEASTIVNAPPRARADEPATVVSSGPSEIAAAMTTLRGRPEPRSVTSTPPPIPAAAARERIHESDLLELEPESISLSQMTPLPPPAVSQMTPLPTPPPALTPMPVLRPTPLVHSPEPSSVSQMTPLPPPGPVSQVTPLPPPPLTPAPPPFAPESVPLPLMSEPSVALRAVTPAPSALAPRRPHRRAGAGRSLIIALVVVALAAGGYVAFQRFVAKEQPVTPPLATRPAVTAADAAPLAVAAPDATRAVAIVAPPDAAPVAVAVVPGDAAPVAVVAVPADAAPVAVAVAAPDAAPAIVPVSDKLHITSDPPGADVYLDGAAKGVTPLDLPATGDRHKLAVLLAGYQLSRQDIDGQGDLAVKLTPVEKFHGEGGIKVVCKTPHRYYIIVDGKDTGLFCPNDQRVSVSRGDHVVTIYDPITETTTPHKISVKQTHLSERVYLSQ